MLFIYNLSSNLRFWILLKTNVRIFLVQRFIIHDFLFLNVYSFVVCV